MKKKFLLDISQKMLLFHFQQFWMKTETTLVFELSTNSKLKLFESRLIWITISCRMDEWRSNPKMNLFLKTMIKFLMKLKQRKLVLQLPIQTEKFTNSKNFLVCQSLYDLLLQISVQKIKHFRKKKLWQSTQN